MRSPDGVEGSTRGEDNNDVIWEIKGARENPSVVVALALNSGGVGMFAVSALQAENTKQKAPVAVVSNVHI